MGSSSFGGPGSITSTLPSCSSHNPGAVPKGLASGSARSGRRACLRLLGVIFRPNLAKRAAIAFSIFLSKTSFCPSTSATRLARAIVARGTESTGGDDHGRPRPTARELEGDRVGVVGQDDVGGERDPPTRELVAEEREVRVRGAAQQQFVAEREEFEAFRSRRRSQGLFLGHTWQCGTVGYSSEKCQPPVPPI